MAVYFARDGTPVATAFALPVNHRGEVTRYTLYGKQRLYTKARLEELDRRAAARNAPRKTTEPSMSQQALDMVRAEFNAFIADHSKLLAEIEEFHHLDETLSLYWEAVSVHGLTLSKRERETARQTIKAIRAFVRSPVNLTVHKIPL